MNIGKNILELRKDRNVKQEELAAELGVTAAAVSKWENGYTLPDLYMLCAMADFFGVTADALLGRDKPGRLAVVAATTEDLGRKIGALAKRYGVAVGSIHTELEEACAAVRANGKVTHALLAYSNEAWNSDLALDFGDRKISMYLNINDSEKNVLAGIEEYLKENQ